MSILSVRLPEDLDKAMPRKDRSAWVIDAVRQRLRRDRIEAIGRSAAEHAAEELEVVREWEHADKPLKARRARRTKR